MLAVCWWLYCYSYVSVAPYSHHILIEHPKPSLVNRAPSSHHILLVYEAIYTKSSFFEHSFQHIHVDAWPSLVYLVCAVRGGWTFLGLLSCRWWTVEPSFSTGCDGGVVHGTFSRLPWRSLVKGRSGAGGCQEGAMANCHAFFAYSLWSQLIVTSHIPFCTAVVICHANHSWPEVVFFFDCCCSQLRY